MPHFPHSTPTVLLAALVQLATFSPQTALSQSTTADSFNPGADRDVVSLAIQADGKILVGGRFSSLGGQPRNGIGRLNADGTLDAAFNPGPDNSVSTLALQADGKILVGGWFHTLGGQTRRYLGRLNADGTLDTAFNPGPEGSSVSTLALQADGKILVGGWFHTLGGQPRNCIGRLKGDGMLDTAFNSSADAEVSAMAVQADGKILVGGVFVMLDGQPCKCFGRLNADGTLDTTFNPSGGVTDDVVETLTVQADGKILVGGGFTLLCGQPRNRIARLNADGTLDTMFNPGAVSRGDFVRTLALQADGKILVGGRFTSLGGQPRNYIGRLNADGTLDTGFNPGADGDVRSLAIQEDGKILVGGVFTNLCGQERHGIGRLVEPVLGPPAMMSGLVVRGTELQPLSYRLNAYPPAAGFGVVGLPPGLTLNAANGAISGAPVYGGTNQVQVLAWNAFGTNSVPLEFHVAYAPLPGLVITELDSAYSRPYLLDFAFSLRTGDDPDTAHAVVRPPASLGVTCLESGVPINPLETAFVIEKGDRRQFKAYLVFDYTRSMTALSNGDADGDRISDAVENMESAAKEFLRQLSSAAQVGLYEFHAEWEDPARLHRPTSDRAALDAAIDSIWSMMQLPDASGASRCWDALLAAVNEFGPPDPDENRYVVFISDGYDTSSLVTYPEVIAAAQAKKVRLYCVAYGQLIDAAPLGELTSQTGGRYFRAQAPASLGSTFALLGKDLGGQYLLRWATLRRNSTPFTPSFQVSVDGRMVQANCPSEYVATSYGTNREVFYGALRLVADAEENADAILLRTMYAPRNIRTLRIHYRPNYPCQALLLSTNAGEILRGWTISETNDGAGARWLKLTSADPTYNTNDIPYGALGNLVQFQFTGLPSPQDAFSLFQVDNTVYASLPGPPTFNLYGADKFLSTNQPPSILAAGLGFTGGHFGFDLSGVSGQLVIVEASSNLVNWTALQTNTMGSVPSHFTDPALGSLPARFYRARLR